MATSDTTYEQTALNKGNRYIKRFNYDKETIHAIVNATPLLHVAFNTPTTNPDEPQFPTVLPMLGAMGTFNPHATPSAPGAFDTTNDDDPTASPAIYLHGSSAARLSRLTSASGATGLPVTVSATLLDGYVLALTPFNHSCNYRSAVIFGHATLVTDESEVLYAMELVTNRLIPNRWENSRVPPTKTEITATGILKVEIRSASAKTRTGMPHDDRKDLKDETMRARVWTGVVPAFDALGEPVPAGDNLAGDVPAYVKGWVERVNQTAEAYATGKGLED